jgi:hypothetical protein
MWKLKTLLLPIAVSVFISACQTTPTQPYDYSAFQKSDPKSILVVLPSNQSVNIKAPFGVLAQTTKPLAESGYYVFPVALVNETFKSNGLTIGNEIQNVSLKKLGDIYNPDAVLYLDVIEYGTKYQVIESVTLVSTKARLVDVRTGIELWSGSASARVGSNDGNNNGLFGALIGAVVNQISSNVRDHSYSVAGVVNQQLLSAGRDKSILPGPYHPNYKKPSSVAQ